MSADVIFHDPLASSCHVFFFSPSQGHHPNCTLRSTNMVMEHGPFSDVFSIENGDIPLLC